MRSQSFIWLGVSLFVCQALPAAGHPVSVKKVTAASGALSPTLLGRAYLVRAQRGDSTAIGAASDYRVQVALPAGTQGNVQPGQKVAVILPILHHQKTQGTVEKVEPHQLTLLLPRQVQELNGQEVRIEVPLKGDGIFKVPFASIYSPRGVKKQVFVVVGGQAEVRDVETISLTEGSEIFVAGMLKADDSVVVQGLDNLIAGDSVTVLEEAR